MKPFDWILWCAEWRRLTGAEAHAIESGAWDSLLSLQEAKARMRTEMEAAESRGQWRGAGMEPDQRNELAELIQLERRNAERLATSLAKAEAERAAVEKSRLDLRRLHQGLIGQPQVGWQSYS